MTLKEYALDVGKSVEEILALCESLDIKVENEDTVLDEMDIVVLDNNIPEDEEDSTSEEFDEEEVEDKAEELAENTKYDLDDSHSIEKVKK